MGPQAVCPTIGPVTFMNPQQQTISRIVIALEAGERDEYALELARWLTPTQAQEVLGLFVESESLLAHAQSRQAREVLLTGAARSLDRHILERQIRAEAARARSRFEAASARLGLVHRFETARGDFLHESIRRAAGAQALVVTMARSFVFGASQRDFCRQLFEAAPPLVLLARHGWLSGRSIAVVANGSDDTLLDAAARIAVHTNSPLIAFVLDGPDGRPESVTGRGAERLRARGVEKFAVVTVNPMTVENIIKATRASSARLLIMPSPRTPDESADIEQLLRQFSGALMFVRS